MILGSLGSQKLRMLKSVCVCVCVFLEKVEGRKEGGVELACRRI